MIYSILCAVFTVYYLLYSKKKERVSFINFSNANFRFISLKVYDLTGAGGLTNIFYAPKGGDNTSIIQANINLIPFNIIEKLFTLNILMLVPFGF